MKKAICGWLMAMLLAGCANGPFALPDARETRAQHIFAIGIDDYEHGRFSDAARNIQSALDLGLTPADQVKAHKHLAFIQCVTGKEKLCRDEFRRALDVSPNLELSPAEAGHPIWGPIFRNIKSKKPLPAK